MPSTNTKRPFLGSVLVLFMLCKITFSLTCFPCKESKCEDVRYLRCKGGTTLGVCGCCTVCTKMEGENCGGPWNIKGVCDKGLICKPKSDLKIGICVNPMARNQKRLPMCFERRLYPRSRGFWKLRKYKGCLNTRTIFCHKNCKRCCQHSTICNPNGNRYIAKSRCQRQIRNYVPSRLSRGDEVADKNDVLNEFEDIKS